MDRPWFPRSACGDPGAPATMLQPLARKIVHPLNPGQSNGVFLLQRQPHTSGLPEEAASAGGLRGLPTIMKTVLVLCQCVCVSTMVEADQ